MDKIAIISDIHGNIPALHAVLEDISPHQVNQIICLGDIVGKGPAPDKAIDLIRERCDTVLQGNWDDIISRPHDREMMNWTAKKIGAVRLDYLSGLPVVFDFWLSGKLVRLCHASPQGIYHRVFPDAPREKIYAMFDDTEYTDCHHPVRKPDIVGYGDIHSAFIRNLAALGNRVLFNAGSVGNSLDSTLASYVILEGMYGQTQASSFAIQFVRVPYDIEASIREAREAHMPELDEYIGELRTARYRDAGK